MTAVFYFFLLPLAACALGLLVCVLLACWQPAPRRDSRAPAPPGDRAAAPPRRGVDGPGRPPFPHAA